MSEQIQQAPVNVPVNVPGTEYVFPAYWGGVTRSSSPPMIHSKIRDLRGHVGSLAAKKQANGPMFPVRGAKELAQKLAQALQDLNMVAPVHSQEIEYIDTDKIPGNASASGKPVFRTLVHVKATVHIGAEDGSFVAVVGSGHGGDTDDKAGGKASTYAWKDALLKGLTVPDQEMMDTDDEAPSEAAERPSAKPATKPAPKAESKAVPKPGPLAAESAESASELEKVLQKIAVASSEQLEEIKNGIKDGSIELAGADKLRASSAFVARRKELETK